MPEQVLIWTAVPAGAAGPTARLSVLVSPRLTPVGGDPPVLSTFPMFADWPSVVRDTTWTVQVDGGPSLTATSDTTPLDSELWRALFGPDVPVRPYGFTDRRGAAVVSYPVQHVLNSLRSTYGQVGVSSPSAPPAVAQLLGDGTRSPGLLDPFAGEWGAATEAMARRQLPSGNDLTPVGVMARFLLFHHQPPPVPMQDLEHAPPDFAAIVDFHQAVASVSSYPALLRALGLLIDLTLDAAELPPAGVLHVLPSVAGPTDVSPGTSFEAGPDSFSAASDPAAGLLREPVLIGFLVLAPQLFTLTELDVDGAGLKANHLATGLQALLTSGSPPATAGLPALRSGGLSLARNERAYLLGELFNRAGRLQEALPGRPTLYLDDLLRGIRVDVWDDVSGSWHSLMQRKGVYSFQAVAGPVTRTFLDEATVEPATTSPAAPGSAPNPDQWLHESLFRWDGWSLAAPRPGTPINRSPDPAKAAEPDPDAGAPLTAFRLATTFTPVEGSLPRLRFGRRYRVRARTVDMAGNSLPPSDPTAELALPAVPEPYRRFEPVTAPLVILRTALPTTSAGETLTRLVLRSRNTNPSLDATVLADPTDRHIAPPRTSVQLAELHGVLDDPLTGRLRVDPVTYAELVARDAAELTDDPTEAPARPEPVLGVTYLPDPLSRGAALRGLPGQPADTRAVARQTGPVDVGRWPVSYPGIDLEIPSDTVTLVDFGGGNWPDRRPFRLVLADANGPPQWDSAGRTLTVAVPKATIATVPLASYLTSADLGLMAVWAWIRQAVEAFPGRVAADPSAAGELEVLTVVTQYLSRRATTGGHWMLTPPLELTLVHAVQQPIGQPAFELLEFLFRGAGSPTAALSGRLRVHGASTVRVDVLARWTEPVDDPSVAEGFRVLNGSGPVDEIRLEDVTAGGPVGAGGNPPRIIGHYDRDKDEVILERADFPGAAGPSTGLIHHFGDPKHRLVRYRAVSTSRFREYFDDVTLDFTRTSAEVLVDIPASARPDVPLVREVVPTFGWQRDTTTSLLSSVRRGGGLRVWLDPPWFSSGEGELLGVLLWPQASQGPTDDERVGLRPYVTQWGVDPLWPSGPVADMPSVTSFAGPVVAGRDLQLPELPGVLLDVAGLPVGFDPLRRRWYADVVLSVAGAYTPFIRLVLARYQPSAIDGAALSPAVVVDTISLAPDRALLATYDPLDPATVTVTVSGTTYQLPDPGLPPPLPPFIRPPRGTVTVTVERSIDDVPDHELGWATAPTGEVTITETEPGPSSDHTLLWHGTVTLPPDRPPGRYRLAVAEEEWLLADPPNRSDGFFGLPRPRVVYADRLPLGRDQ